ncbi:hypothetical protein Hdeb2414_s0011g00371801 [Helianthus debilis subsp. tardiflorus]
MKQEIKVIQLYLFLKPYHILSKTLNFFSFSHRPSNTQDTLIFLLCILFLKKP